MQVLIWRIISLVPRRVRACYGLVRATFATEKKDARKKGAAPLRKLNNGKDMPTFGLGTWVGFDKLKYLNMKKKEIQRATEWAIDAGYRHIDTAHKFNTSRQVANGIKAKIADGVVTRDDMFVATKLWNHKHAKDKVVPGLKRSLEKLNLEYVDLYYIHWPVAANREGVINDSDYVETWQGMIEAQTVGLTKSIGISNFNKQQIERLISKTSVVPQALQVEMNLNLQQPELLAFCRNNNIAVVGHTPFGALLYSKVKKGHSPPPRIDNPDLVSIANKYKKTVPQLALRYLLDLGVAPIPKTILKPRLEENIAVFDFKLSEEDRTALRAFDYNYRTFRLKQYAGSKYYPFEK